MDMNEMSVWVMSIFGSDEQKSRHSRGFLDPEEIYFLVEEELFKNFSCEYMSQEKFEDYNLHVKENFPLGYLSEAEYANLINIEESADKQLTIGVTPQSITIEPIRYKVKEYSEDHGEFYFELNTARVEFKFKSKSFSRLFKLGEFREITEEKYKLTEYKPTEKKQEELLNWIDLYANDEQKTRFLDNALIKEEIYKLAEEDIFKVFQEYEMLQEEIEKKDLVKREYCHEGLTAEEYKNFKEIKKIADNIKSGALKIATNLVVYESSLDWKTEDGVNYIYHHIYAIKVEVVFASITMERTYKLGTYRYKGSQT